MNFGVNFIAGRDCLAARVIGRACHRRRVSAREPVALNRSREHCARPVLIRVNLSRDLSERFVLERVSVP